MVEGRKMKVKRTNDSAVYIHNDLRNTAFYFKNRIAERLKNDDREGVGLEMLAGLTMTAFAMEACFNFVGDFILGAEWKERQPYNTKVETVFAKLGINPDYAQRPFSAIGNLKDLRDALAHGKPERIKEEVIIIGSYDEIDSQHRPQGSWEPMVTPENLLNWFEDMDAIWHLMLEAGNIELFDTLSGGMHGLEFIEYVD